VTYIIGEPCIDLKDRSCIDVCPVDCIHEASRVLVIDPEECIDCGACEPECPVEAIFPEDALPEKWTPFVRINYAYGEGIETVDRLVEEYRDGGDGGAGVREPRTPSPDSPGGAESPEPGA
jgi:NAD-dependent dihydropyrimidine dehydrogenase PreA subunit